MFGFRYALVTGANKGIGFEICRQLASKGIVVILTSRNEKRGIEAIERLKELGLSDYVVFCQLDVVDPASVSDVVEFITTKYGRLDILVSICCAIILHALPRTPVLVGNYNIKEYRFPASLKVRVFSFDESLSVH